MHIMFLFPFQDYAREGLRTLVVAKKHLTHDEYAEWATRHHAARSTRPNTHVLIYMYMYYIVTFWLCCV